MKVKDQHIIDLFKENDGARLDVSLTDSRTSKVWNISWGYDIGDEYAHITTNISPDVQNASIYFFYTNEILRIRKFDGGQILYSVDSLNEKSNPSSR